MIGPRPNSSSNAGNAGSNDGCPAVSGVAPRPQGRHAARWSGRAFVANSALVMLPLAAAALWFASLAHVDVSRMTDLGLVSVLPPSAFAALLLLTISFALAVQRRGTPRLVLLLHVVILIAIIHATPSILYGTLRYSWAWRHVGIVDYIYRHHSVDPGIDAYHNWPGFFALSALALEIAGAGNAIGVATWAPPVFNLLFLGGLLGILRSFTDDRRLLWLASWFFVATNWVGQDYFSPQAFSYFLNLVIIGLCLRWLRGSFPTPLGAVARWRTLAPAPIVRLVHRLVPGPVSDPAWGVEARPPAERSVMFIVAIILFAVIVVSHQLTPFMTILAVTALVVSGRCNARWLPVLMAVMTTTWVVYVATAFLQGNLSWIVQSIFQLFDNVSSTLVNFSQASAGQQFIVLADRSLTATVGGLAILGFIRRLRHGYLDTAAALLMLAPFLMLGGNAYGGEIMFRVYFFSLPYLAFFAAALLYPSEASGTSWRTAAIVVAISVALLMGLTVAYFGQDRMTYFTPNEVASAEYVHDVAPPGALIMDGTSDWPQQYKNYEMYDYQSLVHLDKEDRTRLFEDPVQFIAAIMEDPRYSKAFLTISRSQKAEVDMRGVLPFGSLDRIEQALRESERFQVVYQNSDATVFALRNSASTGGR
ncbi:MAG: hypothetical protein Q7R39_02315 [Dehalococcoidia bacterium]|nr:hypothetical protein [Dehalococcoidia bacterium]